jgi:hypothetical protein
VPGTSRYFLVHRCNVLYTVAPSLSLFGTAAKDIFCLSHGIAGIALLAAGDRQKITHYLQFHDKIYLSRIVHS